VTSATHVARVAVVVGIGGFWTFASIGAAAEPGYDPPREYLSSLAATGAAEPVWGLAMFASATLAVLGAAWCVRSLLLLASGFFLAMGGVFRVDCPSGAAGCNAGPLVVEPALCGQVHSAAVIGYQVLLSAALVALAGTERRAGRRVHASAALAGALVPLVLALDPLPLQPGVSQRVWVAAGQLVLVMLAFWPTRPATVEA
jgi:hypothetical protein